MDIKDLVEESERVDFETESIQAELNSLIGEITINGMRGGLEYNAIKFCLMESVTAILRARAELLNALFICGVGE